MALSLGIELAFRYVLQVMEGVDYVVHAAAIKQIPAAEYNPMECVLTNVIGGA